MKSKVIALICIFVLLLSVPSTHAKEDGIANKSVTGCTCHNGGEGGAQLTINLPEKYSAGQTYSLQINVTNGNGMETSGGFNLKSTNGILSTTDPNAKMASGEIVHSNPNSRTWGVDWLAPMGGSGTVTFTLAALAADGNDGKSGDDWGTLSVDVSEENVPPTVSSVIISPSNPTSSDSLQLSYTYFDGNNDLEDGTTIVWKVDGVVDHNYDDMQLIDFAETTRGEEWSVEVTPSDGENIGVTESQQVTIINSKPIASNLSITPAGPSQFNDLTASWDEYDEDNDIISHTIKWFNNDTSQEELNGFTTVNSSFTEEHEEWHFSVTLNDTFEEQEVFSNKVNLNLINDIPTLENVHIGNVEATTLSDLTAEWDFLDGDGDEQNNFEIKWYLDEMHQSQLDNQLIANSQFTLKGETWYFEVRANDEFEFSEWYQSSGLIIGNSPPEVTAEINPNNPINSTNLMLNITTIDVDNDVLTIEVEWINNNSIFLTNYSDVAPLELRSNDTTVGEMWYANITVSDGDSSVNVTTEPIIIFPNPILDDNQNTEDFTTIAYVQSITYGILTMTIFMLLQFLLSVKANRGRT